MRWCVCEHSMRVGFCFQFAKQIKCSRFVQATARWCVWMTWNRFLSIVYVNLGFGSGPSFSGTQYLLQCIDVVYLSYNSNPVWFFDQQQKMNAFFDTHRALLCTEREKHFGWKMCKCQLHQYSAVRRIYLRFFFANQLECSTRAIESIWFDYLLLSWMVLTAISAHLNDDKPTIRSQSGGPVKFWNDHALNCPYQKYYLP